MLIPATRPTRADSAVTLLGTAPAGLGELPLRRSFYAAVIGFPGHFPNVSGDASGSEQ